MIAPNGVKGRVVLIGYAVLVLFGASRYFVAVAAETRNWLHRFGVAASFVGWLAALLAFLLSGEQRGWPSWPWPCSMSSLVKRRATRAVSGVPAERRATRLVFWPWPVGRISCP